jgi:hypothetical protein
MGWNFNPFKTALDVVSVPFRSHSNSVDYAPTQEQNNRDPAYREFVRAAKERMQFGSKGTTTLRDRAAVDALRGQLPTNGPGLFNQTGSNTARQKVLRARDGVRPTLLTSNQKDKKTLLGA